MAHAGLDPELLPGIAPRSRSSGTLPPEAADGARAAAELPGHRRHRRRPRGRRSAPARSRPGIVVDVTGTAEPVAVPSAEPVLDPERMVETHAHAVDGMLLVENPGFVSGGSTLWWPQRCSAIPQAELFDARRAGAGRRATASLFLPALSGSMAPRWNDGMRGCFAGPGDEPRRPPTWPGRSSRAARSRCATSSTGCDALGLGGRARSGSSAAARARRCGCRSRRT